jgi:sugar/nucleoside kinase (ribokinase family)
MRQNPVVVVGDANVDMVIHLPKSKKETEKADLTQSEPELYGGGTAANVAVALARLGVPVAFVGAVGDDGYGRFVRDGLQAEGIDIHQLHTLHDAFTPMVIAMIQPDGERLIVVWPPERGADVRLAAKHLDAAQIANAAWLHTTGMCLRHSPVRETVLRAMQIAQEAGVPVSLDLNLRLELWGWRDNIRETIDRAVDLADVVFGNAAEEIVPVARMASGAAVEAAAHIVSGGKRIVVARQGLAGALAATPGGTTHAQAFSVENVVDTLGAGDAFNGGFIAAQVECRPVAEALRWGNAVAALKIGQPGARGLPVRAAVEALLAAQSAG